MGGVKHGTDGEAVGAFLGGIEAGSFRGVADEAAGWKAGEQSGPGFLRLAVNTDSLGITARKRTMEVGMSRFGILALALLVACGGSSEDEEDASTSCGDSLTCGAGEFCLSFQAAGAATGEEEYSCEPLPDGCDSFDHMCFDDPDVCSDDWATEVCGENTFTSGCVAIGGAEEAFCQEGTYTSR